MKKILLIIFIITQLFSTSDIKLPSNTLHSHTHFDSLGIEHLYEHSHVELTNTLFCQVQKDKDFSFLSLVTYEKSIDLNSRLIIHSIFRPPIS